MTTYAYMRVSTTEQVDGTSLDNQKRECKGLAMTHAVYIDRYINDGGVSGADPFFERLQHHDVQLVKGDVVIVAKLDRFSRDAADALQTIGELKSRGVRLIINGHGDVTDDSNIVARLMLEIMAVFAGHERRVIKERQKTGQAAKRAAGGHIGGSAKFGYQVGGVGKEARLVADERQQEALAFARKLREDGVSFRVIAGAIWEEYQIKVSHEAVRKALIGGEA
jgi:DNA invertase Pin-like site-specific DNA recombinase